MTSNTLFSSSDREILRRWAATVAELSRQPIEETKKRLWYRHNALEPGRPLVFCSPENAWYEIIPDSSIECQHPLARHWEFQLRMTAFSGQHLQDDMVIEGVFNVPHVYTESGWGMDENVIHPEPGGAYRWDAPLKDLDDLSQLRFPTLNIDWEMQDRHLDLAQETFKDLLSVRRKTSWWWSLGMTWTLAKIRGLETLMWDMIDHPHGLHRLMAFLRDGHLAKIKDLEKNGLLYLNNRGEYVGSGGFGWTDELPGPGHDGGLVRSMDMWGFCESQETGSVSPGMFEEFVFQYQLPVLELFGLNCYGCCEALDDRWTVIKKAPRLRRVSVSPWADLGRMAEYLGNDYVYSMKPNPALVALPDFDEELIRSTLRHALEVTQGCVVELIMKDTHTICHQPERLIRWVQIAREEAERIES